MHVVVAMYRVKPECYDDFRRELQANGADSLAQEAGCRACVIYESRSTAEFFLYQVYATKHAFEQHLLSKHFTEFKNRTATWIHEECEKQVSAKEMAAFSKQQCHEMPWGVKPESGRHRSIH